MWKLHRSSDKPSSNHSIILFLLHNIFLKVYVVTGGVTSDGELTDTTETLIQETGTGWSESARLPNKVEGAAIVSIYNTLYLTG